MTDAVWSQTVLSATHIDLASILARPNSSVELRIKRLLNMPAVLY